MITVCKKTKTQTNSRTCYGYFRLTDRGWIRRGRILCFDGIKVSVQPTVGPVRRTKRKTDRIVRIDLFGCKLAVSVWDYCSDCSLRFVWTKTARVWTDPDTDSRRTVSKTNRKKRLTVGHTGTIRILWEQTVLQVPTSERIKTYLKRNVRNS